MHTLLLKVGMVILLAVFLAGCFTPGYSERKKLIEQREMIE